MLYFGLEEGEGNQRKQGRRRYIFETIKGKILR